MSQPIRTPIVEDTLRRVISADGTEIVLEQVTHGPHDLVLLPGGAAMRTRWAPAAALLEGRFSCWLMDRRGKGDSGDTALYSFDREYDDLAAVAASFDQPVSMGGHSSGALCVLGAALRGVAGGVAHPLRTALAARRRPHPDQAGRGDRGPDRRG